MKKRSHWEVKSTLNEHTYTEFAVWCVEHGLSMSNVLRVVALAGAREDRRLSALVKDYDSDEAKP